MNIKDCLQPLNRRYIALVADAALNTNLTLQPFKISSMQ